jgi:threonine/homoserine/homoserine lactone efflux protein
MFNPKAFLLFLTVVALLALAVEAPQEAVSVWVAIGGVIAAIVIELVMTFGPALRSDRRS